MNTTFMNSWNSKTFDPQRLWLNLSDGVKLRRLNKYVASLNQRIYYTWKNIKQSYKKNKTKISAKPWNEEIELPHGSYSVSDIHEYF